MQLKVVFPSFLTILSCPPLSLRQQWLAEVLKISNESARPKNATDDEIKYVQELVNEFLDIKSHMHLFQNTSDLYS
jgi:hypothetical protein